MKTNMGKNGGAAFWHLRFMISLLGVLAMMFALPTAEGHARSGLCAKLWGQCGGQDFSGPTCCEAGSMCKKQNDWYSQCLPGVETQPTPRPTPPRLTPRPTPAPTPPRPRPRSTPAPTPPTPSSEPEPAPAPAPTPWDGDNMKMTHYWDCSGQGCDAGTLQPWNENKYISPPGYGPQDPNDFGGPLYGEKMWLTGAASDALSQLMGDDDGCCGGDPNDGGVGGCGKCVLVQNPQSMHPDWTAVVMKKNRCPPWSAGCDAGKPHLDIAAPGYDNLQYSTANVCGVRPGTGFDSKQQSATLGSWYKQCTNTAECAHLCDDLPEEFRKGCQLFSSWGWKSGDPSPVKYRAVPCPAKFREHIRAQFDADGAAELFERHSHMMTAKAAEEVQTDSLPPFARNQGFLRPRLLSSHFTMSSMFMQMQNELTKTAFFNVTEDFSEEL